MILYISPRYGSKSDAVSLIQAARKRDIETQTLLASWNKPENIFSPNKIMAVYGEHAFCEFIAEQMDLNLYQNSLDWVARLPHAYVKRLVHYMTLDEIIDTESQRQSILEKKILEPADDPCFQKAIYTDRFPRVPSDTPILVHGQHDWKTKYRFVIINGKIATYCCYQLMQVFNQPSIWGMEFTANETTAVGFMHSLLNHSKTAISCIIDVGFITGVGWAVVKTEPVWAADIYGCDPSKFLDALFACCEQLK